MGGAVDLCARIDSGNMCSKNGLNPKKSINLTLETPRKGLLNAFRLVLSCRRGVRASVLIGRQLVASSKMRKSRSGERKFAHAVSAEVPSREKSCGSVQEFRQFLRPQPWRARTSTARHGDTAKNTRRRQLIAARPHEAVILGTLQNLSHRS